MLTVTFIRHGESEDNLRSVWAGWKDAPLSELGKKQANALGEWFASTPLTHVYASPLLRAHATGKFVQHHQSHPQPPLTVNPDLREQHFGIAEGYPWVLQPPEDTPYEVLYEQKIFPVLYGREEKFPEGESLDDLARRAEEAVKECVLPHLPEAHKKDGVHVAIASHGLCIGEMVPALLRLDPKANRNERHTGLMNTGWTRVEVRFRDSHIGPIDPTSPPPLEVRVTHVNNKEHLKSMKEVPHVAIDGASTEARAFFGGEKVQQNGNL
ncbi:hypothetical protein GALMADRAFT_62388 [Galerina marginata CBS 339.88]|uniref:Phosphoglycerate mutase n=1 Tax=Galerina marginata (strain CBS 339.88) TaxID=685588 RepID=A0A067TMF2_GALM3|nr:hypothetical protein GALMADRAFT_62388 [Galerina marginata CBS 339.88]